MATIAAWALFFGTASAALAHDDLERDKEELFDNCFVCCKATRPALMERLELNEDRCVSLCSDWAARIVEKWID
jgi:hypothetical protein